MTTLAGIVTSIWPLSFMKYDPLSHMDERVWKEEGRGNVKDPIVGSGWILTKEVKLWLTKHVKRSRSPGDGGSYSRFNKVLYFMAFFSCVEVTIVWSSFVNPGALPLAGAGITGSGAAGGRPTWFVFIFLTVTQSCSGDVNQWRGRLQWCSGKTPVCH